MRRSTQRARAAHQILVAARLADRAVARCKGSGLGWQVNICRNHSKPIILKLLALLRGAEKL